MRSLKLSSLIRRNPDRPSLKQRAAALRATATRVMRRRPTVDPDVRDPALAAVQAHRAAYAAWLPHLDLTSELKFGSPESNAAEARAEPFRVAEVAAFEALLEAIPASIDGLLAVTYYLPGAVRRDGRIDEGDLGLQALDAICAGLNSIAGTDCLAFGAHAAVSAGCVASPAAATDPVLEAIAASRAAEAQMAEWQTQASARSGGLTEALFAEEHQLCIVQSRTRDAALSTVPTTHAGRLALVEYIGFVQGLYGINPDENPSLDDAHVWKQTHAALMAAVVAPVSASPPAATPNFSSFTLRQLGGAHETIKNLWLHASGELQAPWCWDAGRDDTNAAGDFLDAESERLAHLLDVITNEAVRRSPANAEERNQILSIRLLHAISGCGGIEDQKLMADVAKAWAA